MEENNGKNLDRIMIKDLLLRCVIGVDEPERREKQDVVINVTLWADLTKAAKTDDINNTVDYKELKKAIVRIVEESEFHLIETLAEKVAQLCLQHSRIEKVSVTIEKPGALRFARSVSVEIIRERS